MNRQSGHGNAFNPSAMLLVILIGALAFIAMLLLGAYAPDLRSGRNGGGHALSNGATGFAGLVKLAEATGRNPSVIRSVPDLRNENLAVITPAERSAKLDQILETRGPRTTLLILSKWQTTPDPRHPGWVRVPALAARGTVEAGLGAAVKFKIARSRGHGEPLSNSVFGMPTGVHFVAPRITQTISGEGLQPVVTTPAGGIVVGRVGSRNLYVLADPDLLNNHGMGDKGQASSALALLDYINSSGADGILFDVTANGLGRSRSPLKLAFEAPFLAVTLTLFTAMLLAAWQALNRFGPIHERERAIAFGKAALVDNSAALIRKAGREARLGGRYADLVRDRAVALFRLPATLSPTALSERLEALNPKRSFAEAVSAARAARSRDALLGAAHALNRWLKEVQQ